MYKEWEEEVEDTITVQGNSVTVKRKRKQYQIICDFCGEVIVDTSKGILGQGYVTVGDKHYHVECYDAMNSLKISSAEEVRKLSLKMEAK